MTPNRIFPVNVETLGELYDTMGRVRLCFHF